MRVYLAGRYGRRKELCGYRGELEAMGIEVTSHWLDGPEQRLISGAVLSPQQEAIIEAGLTTPEAVELAAMCATQDLADVGQAEVIVSFTEPLEADARGRGGSHVEFGMGLVLAKRVIVVGHREHVLHCLDGVEFYPTWVGAKESLCGHPAEARLYGSVFQADEWCGRCGAVLDR